MAPQKPRLSPESVQALGIALTCCGRTEPVRGFARGADALQQWRRPERPAAVM
jgi:hypothetical protein